MAFQVQATSLQIYWKGKPADEYPASEKPIYLSWASQCSHYEIDGSTGRIRVWFDQTQLTQEQWNTVINHWSGWNWTWVNSSTSWQCNDSSVTALPTKHAHEPKDFTCYSLQQPTGSNKPGGTLKWILDFDGYRNPITITHMVFGNAAQGDGTIACSEMEPVHLQGVQTASYETDYGTGHTVTIQAKPAPGWSIDYIEYERDVDGEEVESIRVTGNSSFTKSFTATADSDIDIYTRFYYKQVTRTSYVRTQYVEAFSEAPLDYVNSATPVQDTIQISSDDWFTKSYDLPLPNDSPTRAVLNGPENITYTLSASHEYKIRRQITNWLTRVDSEFVGWNTSEDGYSRWPNFVLDTQNPITLQTLIGSGSRLTLRPYYRFKQRQLSVVCVPWYGGIPLAYGLSVLQDDPSNQFLQSNVGFGERKLDSAAVRPKAADEEILRSGYESVWYGMAAGGCIPAVGFTPCYLKTPTGETFPMVQGRNPWGTYQSKPEQWWCDLSASYNWPGSTRTFKRGIPFDEDCVLSIYLSGEGLLYNVDNDKLLHGTHETNNGLMYFDDTVQEPNPIPGM